MAKVPHSLERCVMRRGLLDIQNILTTVNHMEGLKLLQTWTIFAFWQEKRLPHLLHQSRFVFYCFLVICRNHCLSKEGRPRTSSSILSLSSLALHSVQPETSMQFLVICLSPFPSQHLRLSWALRSSCEADSHIWVDFSHQHSSKSLPCQLLCNWRIHFLMSQKGLMTCSLWAPYSDILTAKFAWGLSRLAPVFFWLSQFSRGSCVLPWGWSHIWMEICPQAFVLYHRCK